MTPKERTKLHEGKRLKPYKDTLGILTIGYGRNLEHVGISDEEADLMFDNDWRKAESLAQTFAVYGELDEVRQGVLTEMVFQMGRAGVAAFKKFLSACAAKDWDAAAAEMLDSKWAEQTPKRAQELAEIFRNGQ